jgi:hypothetical protein
VIARYLAVSHRDADCQNSLASSASPTPRSPSRRQPHPRHHPHPTRPSLRRRLPRQPLPLGRRPHQRLDYTHGGYQVLEKWLSYRELTLLGRPLHEDEARYFAQGPGASPPSSSWAPPSKPATPPSSPPPPAPHRKSKYPEALASRTRFSPYSPSYNQQLTPPKGTPPHSRKSDPLLFEVHP